MVEKVAFEWKAQRGKKAIMVDIWRSVFSVRENTFKESNVRKSLVFSNHQQFRATIMLEQGKEDKNRQCVQNGTPGRAYTWFCKVLYDSTCHSEWDHKLLKVTEQVSYMTSIILCSCLCIECRLQVMANVEEREYLKIQMKYELTWTGWIITIVRFV